MSTIVVWFKKSWLVVTIIALGFAFMPLASAYAIAPPDPMATPATTPVPAQKGTERLARVWAREQDIYGKIGTFLNNVDQRITKGQDLINKAKANGKDTSALQTALDAFSAAVKQAQSIYQSAQGIVSSHSGFDANGQVTDQAQALTTVQNLGGKFQGYPSVASRSKSGTP